MDLARVVSGSSGFCSGRAGIDGDASAAYDLSSRAVIVGCTWVRKLSLAACFRTFFMI